MLSRTSHHDLIKNLEPKGVESDTTFSKALKPLLSNTDPMSYKIILAENGEILQKESLVAECRNSHIFSMTD